jgi:subtilase-type serine protease
VFKFSYIGNPNNAIRGQAIAPLRYSRWGTFFGVGGSTDHDGNADGYKSTYGGLMAGIDRALWTGTRIGLYLSAAAGDVSMKNLDESSDILGASVGMYLRQEMYYGYWLTAAGFGVDSYDTERNLTMLNHRAESKTHAKIGSVYLERGIDIPVYYATLQPYTSFQVVSVHQDKFTERMWDRWGRYSDSGLESVKGRTDSFRLGIGARAASQPIPVRWGQLAITGNMAWFHEFQGKQDRDFIARFANPGGCNFNTKFSDVTFRIDGNDPKQDWVNLGLGFNMDRNSTRVFLAGDLFTSSRQTLFSGTAGVIVGW